MTGVELPDPLGRPRVREDLDVRYLNSARIDGVKTIASLLDLNEKDRLILLKNGVRTVAELLLKTRQELVSLGIGVKRLNNLEESLTARGVSLKSSS